MLFAWNICGPGVSLAEAWKHAGGRQQSFNQPMTWRPSLTAKCLGE